MTVPEEAGRALFTVSLSQPSTETVTAAYITADGTAHAGSDYTARSGTLTFRPGETGRKIAVPVLDDNAEEADETFTVWLSNPRNAILADPEGIATITDDDPAEPPPPPPPPLPALTIDDVTVAEDAGSARFTVSLSEPSAETVTVDYATSDVRHGDRRLRLPPRPLPTTPPRVARSRSSPATTARTIAIPVLDDSADEADETFTVGLTRPRNATLADSEGTATITDDDPAEPPPPPPPPLPALAIDDVTVPEDAGSARFTVSLSEPSAETVTVDYATSDGTAEAASDYTAARGSLTFQPGDTARTIAIPVLDDSADEADETFTVGLTSRATRPWPIPRGPPPSGTSSTSRSGSPSVPGHTP